MRCGGGVVQKVLLLAASIASWPGYVTGSRPLSLSFGRCKIHHLSYNLLTYTNAIHVVIVLQLRKTFKISRGALFLATTVGMHSLSIG